MKNKTVILSLLALLAACTAFGQTTMVSTTLSSAVGATDQFVNLTSATGVSAPGSLNQTSTLLYIDKEPMQVLSVSGTRIGVQRNSTATHASGAKVWVGPPSAYGLNVPSGSCVAAAQPYLPLIVNGDDYACTNGRWGRSADKAFFVSPSNCSFSPTTLTTTNTYAPVGASAVFVLNATSNAAAGTNTLTCNIMLPTRIAALKGAVITDITLFVGSQTTAPTSLGTATLGSITFPAAATSETASTVTPVTVGGTVTTVSPTQITTVTTAGSFLTIKHSFSTVVDLSTDLQIFRYTMPFLQSAAAAMTLNTPGLLVHYREAE